MPDRWLLRADRSLLTTIVSELQTSGLAALVAVNREFWLFNKTVKCFADFQINIAIIAVNICWQKRQFVIEALVGTVCYKLLTNRTGNIHHNYGYSCY